jgi:hypothetical protein
MYPRHFASLREGRQLVDSVDIVDLSTPVHTPLAGGQTEFSADPAARNSELQEIPEADGRDRRERAVSVRRQYPRSDLHAGAGHGEGKSTDSLVYTKEISAVDNPPGEEVDDIAVALKKVREGVKVNFQGAGSICDFDARGDQLNRHFGHFRIEKGKQVLVQIIEGPKG